MAAGSGVGNKALEDTLKGLIAWHNDTLKVMLVDDDYVFDPDVDVVDPDDDSVNDAHHHEIVATNYTGGFGGAGRKTATVGVAEDDANDRVVVTIADLTWSSLGGAANDTVGAVLLIKEDTDDTQSRVLMCFDCADTLTNGGDFTTDFPATGVLAIG
jgi:hypothetical protein